MPASVRPRVHMPGPFCRTTRVDGPCPCPALHLQDINGSKVLWGAVKYEDLLGPNGWCGADVPKFQCPCR